MKKTPFWRRWAQSLLSALAKEVAYELALEQSRTAGQVLQCYAQAEERAVSSGG